MKPKENIAEPTIALLTKHGKECILEPILNIAFGTVLVQTNVFDTDTLGTFDNTVNRTLSPVNAALKKAYLACEITGLNQGLGSEGSFNTSISGATNNAEVIAFVDIKQGWEIFGFAQKFISLQLMEAKNEVALGELMQPYIERFGTSQKWLLWQDGQYHKGLDYTQLLPLISQWPCTIEPDFRAMNCPDRQHTISEACKDLVRCLNSYCPECNAPNFVEKHTPDLQTYLMCEFCGSNTTKQVAPRAKCDNCGFTESNKNHPTTAPVIFCTVCNP